MNHARMTVVVSPATAWAAAMVAVPPVVMTPGVHEGAEQTGCTDDESEHGGCLLAPQLDARSFREFAGDHEET